MYVRPYTIFSTFHPVILLLYGLGAPVLAMFSKEPLCLILSFFGACGIRGFYLGRKGVENGCKLALPFLIFLTVFNMLTNSGGETVLFRIAERNFTLESLCYGLANGLMLSAVVLWFGCFTAILPNDKFLYLFGKYFQNTGLLLSMILKLFPETSYKIRCIELADGAKGLDEKQGMVKQIHQGMRHISCLLEWSMEDSIETADSMKARGYGTGKRTSYANYRLVGYDIGMMIVMVLLFVPALLGVIWQDQSFYFFPIIHRREALSVIFILFNSCYLLFIIMPMLVEIRIKGGKRTCRSWK